MTRAFVAVVATAALTACQTLPRDAPAVAGALPPGQAFAERQQEVAEMDGWTLRGRGALSAHGRGWNGSVNWAQCGEALDLRFIAPLGAGTVRITGEPEFMRVQGTDGTDFVTSQIALDLEAWLGVGVPVRTLRWWVLGVPAPGEPASGLALDAAGRATAFDQAGWAVSYPRYTVHAGAAVPAVVVAEQDGTRVRMVVDRWEPSDCR